MSIYPHTPYVYLIGWSQHDRYYIGAKYAAGCHPKDFWVKYFTSSEYVAEFREEHGEPDIIQIRQTFIEPSKAAEYERTILRRLNVISNERFLNASIGMGKFAHRSGFTLTDSHKKKISNAAKKRPPVSEETKMKLKVPKSKDHIEKMVATRKARNNYRHTEKTKKKIGESQIGRRHSEESLLKMRLKALQRNEYKTVECPVCGKRGKENAMNRWHFQNCRFYETQ